MRRKVQADLLCLLITSVNSSWSHSIGPVDHLNFTLYRWWAVHSYGICEHYGRHPHNTSIQVDAYKTVFGQSQVATSRTAVSLFKLLCWLYFSKRLLLGLHSWMLSWWSNTLGGVCASLWSLSKQLLKLVWFKTDLQCTDKSSIMNYKDRKEAEIFRLHPAARSTLNHLKSLKRSANRDSRTTVGTLGGEICRSVASLYPTVRPSCMSGSEKWIISRRDFSLLFPWISWEQESVADLRLNSQASSINSPDTSKHKTPKSAAWACSIGPPLVWL